MRKILLLLLLAAAPVLALKVQPVQAATAKVEPSEQELLVIKKKKAEAARKAAAKKLAIKKAAGKKRLDAMKRARLTKVRKTQSAALQGRAVASRRDCSGFLSCLLGRKGGPNVRPSSMARVLRASTGRQAGDVSTSEVVAWAPGAKYSPGSLVVRTPERALYLVLSDGKARRYSVGVGREGFQWSGNSKIVAKQVWPTWRPPQVMIDREAEKGHFLPDEMEGGPENPLGARALYIGGTMYRIHGTNNATSIGGAVSSGCIRMMNTDVIDLYGRVKIGARVYVYQ